VFDISIRKRLNSFTLDAKLKDEGFICVTGVNGSGKTSLLLSIAGFYTIDEGYINIGGGDVSRLPIHKRRIVLVNQETHFPEMKVETHLLWGARSRHFRVTEEEVAEVRLRLGISFRGKVRELSQGQKQKLSIATAILSKPKMILVDEAFSAISDRETFVANFRTISSDRKIDVIYTSPELEGKLLADHCYKMEQGVTRRLF
jgi:molybdate/tungstate transport system ATP-binding protein